MSNALFTITFYGEFDNNIFVHTIMDGLENMKTCDCLLFITCICDVRTLKCKPFDVITAQG